jgi:hypothetical protein
MKSDQPDASLSKLTATGSIMLEGEQPTPLGQTSLDGSGKPHRTRSVRLLAFERCGVRHDPN